MKWIQIKNPKWIGRLAEEDVIPKSKTKPKASHEEDRDNWPEVDRWKRSAPEADRRRGSELDDGSDVDDSRAGNVERVSLRGLRWEMTVNEREWMRPDLIKWKKKKEKKRRSKLYRIEVSLTMAATLREWSLRGMRDERERVRMRVNEWLDLIKIIKWIKNRNNEVRLNKI